MHRCSLGFGCAAAALIATTSGLAARAADAAGSEAAPATTADPLRAEVDANLGVGARLGAGSTNAITERGGFVFGASAFVVPFRWVAVGAGYEHQSLDRERTSIGDTGLVNISRDLNTLWLLARFYPVTSDVGGIYLGLGAGLVWQSADADGLTFQGPFTSDATAFSCQGAASANLGLRIAAGGDVVLAGGLRLFGELAFDSDRLTDSTLSDCCVGAGSVTSLAVHAGLAYRFDVPVVR